MGVWIAARPKLHIPGLINSRVDECHITLGYLGKVDPDDVMAKMQEGSQFYRSNYWPHQPVICEISGLARWISAEGYHVDVALVAPPIPKLEGSSDIYDLHRQVQAKVKSDFPVDETYPFVPHITLPNGFDVEATKQRPVLHSRVMFSITELYVCHTSEGGAVNTLITQPE